MVNRPHALARARRPAPLAGVLAVLLLSFGLPLMPGCSSGPDENVRFVGLADRYLDAILARNPVWATSLGEHRYDALWPDLTPAGIADLVACHRAYLDSLAAVDRERLDEANAVDYAILHEQIEAALFRLEELREHTWNPLLYNPGDGIYGLVAREFAPLAERLRSVKGRLEGLPDLLAAARANLEHPPRIFTETAIEQNQGVISLVLDGLQPHLDRAPQLRDELLAARSAAIAALEDYGRWLEDELLPRSDGDFRLGAELWRKKLRYALASDLEPAEILERAEADLAATRAEMRRVAEPLYREYFPQDDGPKGEDDQTVIGRVLDRIADDHPSDSTIVEQAASDLARLTEFVRDQNLVGVPDEPLALIVMPEHQRGVWIAYCDAPGPLEKHGKTFYAIAPTPSDWDASRKASFYREYNDAMLQVLTIHEAMPGHYLQIAHANAFEAPTPVRAVFASGTFVEGWATYAEQLMVDAGWDGPEVHLQQLKMRLRMIINAIIDNKIHTQGMTEADAMKLMKVEGFQEEGEAAGKWRRACLTSTQLSTYYVGNLEINGIRADWQDMMGDAYEGRAFHDRLLGYGSPPPKYVRELLGLPAT
jgi:uncharacterized protein (DUF885 family)